MKKCWLFNEDYFKFIKSIKSNSIDLILSDPPYNINKYSTGNINVKGRKVINNNIADWDKIEIEPSELAFEFSPTQKPISLLEKIINISSNENSIVFDPFMGLGSTGVAALKLNRRFLGIEIDPVYYQAAKKRIEKYI